MKRWILLALLTASCAITTGCGDGIAHTHRERVHLYKKGLQRDMRMLNDDIDLFLLNERPSRLSWWATE